MEPTNGLASELNLSDIKKQLTINAPTIDLDFGDNKILQAKQWAGKQLIEYGKYIEELEHKIENVDLYDSMMSIVASALVEPCIVSDKPYFLNNHELHYALIKIREFSLPNTPIVHSFICDNEQCQHTEQVQIKINDLEQNTKKANNGVLVLSNGITLYIGDMKNPDAIKSKDKEMLLLNELCLRVNKVEYKGNSTSMIVFNDLLDILCSLPSAVFDELIDKYIDEFSFSYELLPYHFKCPVCKKEYQIDCNDLLMLVEGL